MIQWQRKGGGSGGGDGGDEEVEEDVFEGPTVQLIDLKIRKYSR